MEDMMRLQQYKYLNYAKAVLAGGVSLFGLGTFYNYYIDTDPIEFTVVDKLVKTEQWGESAKGVYYILAETPNGPEVFENTDSLFKLKFDSSDLYQKLEVGKTYKGKTTQFRCRFLSLYKNIIDADLVPDSSHVSTHLLESRFASALLKMIKENPDMDILEGIKAYTVFEAVKDKQNASKIRVLGNKYQEKYIKSENKEEFQSLLKKAESGKEIAMRLNQNRSRNSFEKGSILYYQMSQNNQMG